MFKYLKLGNYYKYQTLYLLDKGIVFIFCAEISEKRLVVLNAY